MGITWYHEVDPSVFNLITRNTFKTRHKHTKSVENALLQKMHYLLYDQFSQIWYRYRSRRIFSNSKQVLKILFWHVLSGKISIQRFEQIWNFFWVRSEFFNTSFMNRRLGRLENLKNKTKNPLNWEICLKNSHLERFFLCVDEFVK